MLARQKFAHYEILSELGRGAQGQVFLAQDSRLGRKVALKILSASFSASANAVQRFRREAEAASRLDHPSICSVYEAGEWQGQHFIAMRFVEGDTLAGKIASAQRHASTNAVEIVKTAQAGDATVASDAAPVAIEDNPPDKSGGTRGDSSTGPASRAEILAVVGLIERAARGLHAAHEVGLIHRDIKPGNILVTSEGEPVILDFGLARDDSDGDEITMSGDLLGTPAYMSPEQLLAQRVRLDRRTDVYSLGVTLYECLTLRRPYEAASREALYQKILAGDLPDAARLNRRLPKDLKVVLATALERDRDRRYKTALDFAEDLRRVRCFEPILARPAGPWLRFQRWVQRNPVAATVVVGIFLLLITALTLTTVLLQRVRQEEHEALKKAQEAKDALVLVEEKSRVVTATLLELKKESELREKALQDLGAALNSTEGLRLASQAAGALNHSPGLALLLALEAAKTQSSTILRNSLIEILKANREERVIPFSKGLSSGSAFSAAGDRFLALSSRGGGAPIVDVKTGSTLCLVGTDRQSTDFAVFSADGSQVLLARYGRTDPSVWSARDGALVATLRGHSSVVGGAAFDAEGDSVLTVAHDGTGRVFRLPSGELTAQFDVGGKISLHQALYSTDGERLIACSEGMFRTYEISPDGNSRVSSFTYNSAPSAAYVLSARSGAILHTLGGHQGMVRAVLSPDGERVLTLSADSGRHRIWSLSTGETLVTLQTRRPARLGLFSPDSQKLLLISTGSRQAELFDASTGASLSFLRGHTSSILAAAWSPDGNQILTGAGDTTMRLWDAASGEPLTVLRGHDAGPFLVAFGQAPGQVVSAAEDGSVRLWDVSADRGFARVDLALKAPLGLRFTPDGNRVLATTRAGLSIASAETGQEVARISLKRKNGLLALLGLAPGAGPNMGFSVVSADSKRILVQWWDGKQNLEIWDLEKGLRLSRLESTEPMTSGARAQALSGDGRYAAVALPKLSEVPGPQGLSGSTRVSAQSTTIIRVHDAASGKLLVEFALEDSPGSLSTLSFSASGSRLFASLGSGGVKVFDVAEGKPLWSASRLESGVIEEAVFSPDGKLVACKQWTERVSLLNGDTGAPGATLRGHGATVRKVEFSADSTRVLTTSDDRTARLWDCASGEELLVLRGHAAALRDAHLGPDGQSILTFAEDQTVKVWDARPGLATGRELLTLPHDEQIRSAVFAPGGGHIETITESDALYRWPLDVVSAAQKRKTRELTAAERERFQVGNPAERKRHQFQNRVDEQLSELASVNNRRRGKESTDSLLSSLLGVLRELQSLITEDATDERLLAALPEVGSTFLEVASQLAAEGQDVAAAFAHLCDIQARAGNQRAALDILEAGERIAGPSPALELRLQVARKRLLPDLPSFASIDDSLVAPITLVAPGSSWRFFRGRAEPSASMEWTRLGFDDAGWEEGPGGFGYGDDDDATVLADMRGNYTTLYLRRVVELPDPVACTRPVLVVTADDGFVAYVNGQEVARFLAGKQGARLPATATADAEAVEPLVPIEIDFASDSLRPGKNVLALQVLNSSLRSSDLSCIVELHASPVPSSMEDERRLASFRAVANGGDAPERIRYLEALTLERAGKLAEAAGLLAEILKSEAGVPEAVLSLARCQRKLRRYGEAELTLRGAIERGVQGGAALWTGWLETTMLELGWSMERIQTAWPQSSNQLLSRTGGRILEVFRVLASGSTLRLRCGGGQLLDASGKTWQADSFFHGGSPAGAAPAAGITGTPDVALHASHRWFPEARDASGYPGYNVPVLPGRYRVTLHFAEVYHARGGRSFDVLAAGTRVLEAYDPFKAGFKVATRESFELELKGPWLKLEFVRRAGNPMVSAIELEPLAAR